MSILDEGKPKSDTVKLVLIYTIFYSINHRNMIAAMKPHYLAYDITAHVKSRAWLFFKVFFTNHDDIVKVYVQGVNWKFTFQISLYLAQRRFIFLLDCMLTLLID